MSETKLEMKLVDKIEGKFFVPSYQRGYRWGKSEIIRLLDDIYNLLDYSDMNVMRNSKNYCLQPIVVKKLGENYFEVIDGQQRLTTLFIIYNYFDLEPNFFLEYETRDKSEEFLKNIDVNRRNENIDFYFMANALETLEEWTNQKISDGKTRRRDIKKNLENLFCYNVRVIWYETDDAENSAALFTRLNIGKIPLTSAELVKAMFLSTGNSDTDKRKQFEIALQWDNLEKELHNNSLWYFLTNNSPEKYQTRIDLILDLMSEKDLQSREKYFTFFYFDDLRKKENLNDVWEKITKNFLLLKDWHENHELYHKIGYLITSGYKNLFEIYKISQEKNKTKKIFLSELDALIKESISIKEDENYSNWNYNDDREKIQRFLLLFNVESVRQNGENSQWFPFDKYKFGKDGKNFWSLEHIHAVKSQKIGTQEMWRDWLKLHLNSLEKLQGDYADLITEIKNALKLQELKYKKFEGLQNKIIDVLSPEKETEEYLNLLPNLALLRCEENSALGNSTFDVKRNSIIKMDMAGEFIPFCTKMVFLKYYTESEKNQLHFWSKFDRKSYVAAINEVLKNYLQKPVAVV